MRTVHIIGAGWSGLSAAVRALECGLEVHLYESRSRAGGRAGSHRQGEKTFDHGQHILIGAYTQCRTLLEKLHPPSTELFEKIPLDLARPHAKGFRLPKDRWPMKLPRALLMHPTWSWSNKLELCTSLLKMGFSTPQRTVLSHLWQEDGTKGADMSVKDFFRALPPIVVQEVLEPLCLSALNTPIDVASARLFIRVLKKTLENLPNSCELWLPKLPLSDLLPDPAVLWLESKGAHLHFSTRIEQLKDLGEKAQLIIATSAHEASRLCLKRAEHWSKCAQSLRHQGVCTVYLSAQGSSQAHALAPLVALQPTRPESAQFALKLSHPVTAQNSPHPETSLAPNEQLHRLQFALVCSASPRSEKSDFVQAMLEQAQHELQLEDIRLEHFVHEKRATFSAELGLQRPWTRIDETLWAAGDYVAGPYPATLEGAVISGARAVNQMLGLHPAASRK